MTDQPAGASHELSRAEMMEAIWKQTRLTGHVIERLRHEVDRVIERAHRELVPDREEPAPWLDAAAGPQGDISELVRAELGLLIPALVKKEVDAQFRHFTEKLKARMQTAERPLPQKLGAVRSRKGR
jgi:hypothetical protein